jgi:uncharacterized membrane protein YkvA (DUF1232 family)
MRDFEPDYLDDEPAVRGRARELPGADDMPIQRPRLRRRSRGEGDRETLKQLVRDLPHFVRLLLRLYRDPRVSRVDKGIVLATVAYMVMPMDLVPDWIPVLGQVDDIYLLALALDRLLNNAGVEVLLDHWEGDVASLETAIAALDKAGSFLPEQVRALLRQRVG